MRISKVTVQTFLWLSLLFISCRAFSQNAQSAQNKYFTIGLSVGADPFWSKSVPVGGVNANKDAEVVYDPKFTYGIAGSYHLNRALINVRLLATNRSYSVNTTTRLFSPPGGQPLPVHVEVGARYYSLPLSFSYLIKRAKNVQLYAGVSIVPEWINGSFSRKSYDILGSGRFIVLDPEKPVKSFLLGSAIQLTADYSINQKLSCQLQPGFYYFSKVYTPFATTDNSTLRVTLSVSYKLNGTKNS